MSPITAKQSSRTTMLRMAKRASEFVVPGKIMIPLLLGVAVAWGVAVDCGVAVACGVAVGCGVTVARGVLVGRAVAVGSVVAVSAASAADPVLASRVVADCATDESGRTVPSTPVPEPDALTVHATSKQETAISAARAMRYPCRRDSLTVRRPPARAHWGNRANMDNTPSRPDIASGAGFNRSVSRKGFA
jgi:hypothetical protein